MRDCSECCSDKTNCDRCRDNPKYSDYPTSSFFFLNINQYVHRGILIVYVIRLILSVIIHCIIKILMEI